MEMTVEPTTKKAALFSGILHLSALLFLILGVIFTNLFARKDDPYIFEMVALPESVDTFQPESLEPIPDLTIDLPEFEPIELLPEPIVEEPPPSKPEPVIQTAPPVRVEKLKPEPKKEEPKPEIISFDQFVKEHGKPEAPKTPPKPRVVKPRKIDTSKIEQNLRQLSVPELSLTTQTTTVDTDAMKRWRSLLAARLDVLWKQSQTEGTAAKSVKVSFYISSGGAISSVRVVVSSGLSDLDATGIDTVLRLGVFQPPPSGTGDTVTVLFKVE
ncbi:MAG: TonB family protein [Verrucomicrobia bacterium]|nr:TonB family protein [Verrucomicrobiota bacterium]